MPPLVVEFIGLPGAGKTTIAQHLIADLTTAGYQCFSLNSLHNPEGVEKKKGGVLSKASTLFKFLFSCLRNAGMCRHAFLYAWQIKPRSMDKFLRFFVLLVRVHDLRTLLRKNNDLVILDQGILQNIWSLAATGDPPKDSIHLKRLLNSVLKKIPSFVVQIDVEAETAVDRIQHRPTMRSRYDQMSPLQAVALLTKYQGIFAQIIHAADYFQDTGFLYVNGSQPIRHSVDRIVPVIEREWQGSGF